MDNTSFKRMQELIRKLNEASRAYYDENREVMTNLAYDALYDELEKLEAETGTILAGSPTQKVGYETMSALPKETHDKPMLSLGKTKSVEELRAFIGTRKTLISWKLDGLTVVMTYRGGNLVKAVTRGNGITGDVITANARTFRNIPLRIPFTGELVLRGEAVISYPDFEKINEALGEDAVQYKNPRNLCSGSVRQLNSRVTAERSVRFYAFSLVEASTGPAQGASTGAKPEASIGAETNASREAVTDTVSGTVRAERPEFDNSHEKEFEFLKQQGFEVVEYISVTADTLDQTIDYFAGKIKTFEIPSDGLVALYDDIAYGEELGETAKTPRNAIAFKWKDEQALTHLKEIEWSPSRTGLINPVAIFDAVELEGTTVSRASVHNISILRELKLGIGDEISVYKANMIIPQIAENLTQSNTVVIPEICPVCGGRTAIHRKLGTETLICTNPDCTAKKIKRFTQFVSRDGLNIEGLSEMTLEKFIQKGFLHSFADLFRLKAHHDDIVSMEGFGQKSASNLEHNIENARSTTLPRLLYALGIPNIGDANAKMIAHAFSQDLDRVRNAQETELSQIEGIGPIMAQAFAAWFRDPENVMQLDDLLQEISIEKPSPAGGESVKTGSALAGKVFVVTGAVHHFKNRKELSEAIAAAGGKVTGSVSARTDYLINNDAASASSKNQTARKLGIPIMTEEDLLALLGEN